MADLNNGYAYLEDIKLYGPPNRVLAEILIGPLMYNIVADYTAKVVSNVVTQYGKSGGSGTSVETMEATVDIGNSFKRDRWAGQITITTEYAQATQYGRHQYAPYAGKQYLTKALYGVLPHRP